MSLTPIPVAGSTAPAVPTGVIAASGATAPVVPNAPIIAGVMGYNPAVPTGVILDSVGYEFVGSLAEVNNSAIVVFYAADVSTTEAALMAGAFVGGRLVVANGSRGILSAVVLQNSPLDELNIELTLDASLSAANSTPATLRTHARWAPGVDSPFSVGGAAVPAVPAAAIATSGGVAPVVPSVPIIEGVMAYNPAVPVAIVVDGEQPPAAVYVQPDAPVAVAHTVPLENTQNYRVMVGSRATSVTIALPDPGGIGQDIEIIDASMQANVHAVTITGGSRLIEGQPTLVLTYPGAAVRITYTGSAWKITS